MPRALSPAIRVIAAVLIVFVVSAGSARAQEVLEPVAQVCQGYTARIVAPVVVLRDLEANRLKVAEFLLAQASPDEREFFERELANIWRQGLPIRAVLEEFYRRCIELGSDDDLDCRLLHGSGSALFDRGHARPDR